MTTGEERKAIRMELNGWPWRPKVPAFLPVLDDLDKARELLALTHHNLFAAAGIRMGAVEAFLKATE